MTKNPPTIWHSGTRRKGYEDVIRDCAFNLHLSGRETALLGYYAGCGNGFRTSLADIERKTGIRRDKVSTVRAGLVRRGIILYEDGHITVMWKRIWQFASLPVRLSKRDSLHGTFFPAAAKRPPTLGRLASRMHDDDAYRVTHIRPRQRVLSDSEIRFVKFLERLTEKEYEQLLNFWRNEGHDHEGKL